MPLLDGLDFTRQNLQVSYQAERQPQEVEITLRLNAPAQSASEWPAIILHEVLTSATLGSAGGETFPPTSGAGVVQDEHSTPAQYLWRVQLGGVDPLFLRCMVEHLGTSGEVTSLHIQGSQPLRGDALSVTTDKLRSWLDDPTAYPGEWHSPGFAIKCAGTWPGFRVQTEAPIDAELRHQLDRRALLWLTDVRLYMAPNGLYEGVDTWRSMPRTGAGGKEFAAAFDRLEVEWLAARARLINGLCQFHNTVAPLRAVEIPV